MDKKNLIKYILCGIGYVAVVVLVISLVRSLLNSGVTFADGLRNPYIWLCAVLAGVSTAWTQWKKSSKK